ncbi:MAG: HIT domain-containing protein [Mycoplasmataceae bacterium]|jgi:histidine triad (HIT) family protein|nr:HIT domain-containing protein [Mycoplasmataceae bacterium]
MDECIFCLIAEKKIKSYTVLENNLAYAFLDINPISKGHTIIIPKKHFSSFSKTDDEYLFAVIDLSKKVASLLQTKFSDIKGFNYLSNENEIAGQSVFHFHMHVIPKYEKNEGFIFTESSKKDQINVADVYNKLHNEG